MGSFEGQGAQKADRIRVAEFYRLVDLGYLGCDFGIGVDADECAGGSRGSGVLTGDAFCSHRLAANYAATAISASWMNGNRSVGAHA